MDKKVGYVKLWRSINDHEILSNDNNAFIVFVRLISIVDWQTGSYTTGRKKLAVYMNMKESTLYSVLKRLERATLLQLDSNTYATTFHICNWSMWQQDDNAVTSKSQSKSNTKQEERNKKNIDTKVSNDKDMVKAPSNEINELFEYWNEVTGVELQGKVRANRYAASNLLKKHGLENVKRLIDGVNIAQHTEFAPKISDFIELQNKINKLVTWGKTINQTKSGKVAKV